MADYVSNMTKSTTLSSGATTAFEQLAAAFAADAGNGL
jgi:hypothetical protein